MARDLITLTVPARGEYARPVRMTAAALASRMDMGFDDVDDFRIAVEEAFVYAVDAAGAEGQIELYFTVEDGAIELRVALAGQVDEADEEIARRTSYATFILESVCDEFDLFSDEQGRAWIRLVKRAGSVDAD